MKTPPKAIRLAKLSRPTQTGVVPRSRLFSRLDALRDGSSAIWVAGPPGCGKTTLVAEYLDLFALDYVWYQIDESDADIATFFFYMAQALQDRGPGQHRHLPAFSSRYLNDVPAFTREFFREFFSRLSRPFALVFDNHHEVPAQAQLHEALLQAVEEIPEGGYVLIIGRADPPSSFARLRANRRLATLGWHDLRLTREESDEIVEARGFELPDHACDQLYARTQGWAAGVVLMLEHLRSQGTVAEIPQSFTPNVIFDYLAGEVIKHFDEAHQRFMLKTALLPHITADLAERFTGRDDAATILDYVARRDYFVSTKQADGEIAYQYHPLLREFLLKHADETFGKDETARLRSGAAELMESAGQIEEAIALRIDNREWGEAGRLIGQHSSTIFGQGRGETIERWLEELPRERLSRDPALLCCLGECRLALSPRESRRHYEKAFELFLAQEGPDVEGLFRACAGVLGAVLHELDDLTILDRWIGEVDSLRERYPEFPARPYGEWTTCYMYMALVFRQPFHPDIERWAERTYTILQSTEDDAVRLQAAIVLVSGIAWTGRFAKATEIIESIRRLAAEPEISPFFLCTLRMVESMYYMLDGQTQRCLEAVRTGVETGRTAGIRIWENSTLLNGAGGALTAGDLTTAEKMLGELDQGALATRRFDSCVYHFFSAWLSLLKGDVLSAYQQQRTAQRLAGDMGLPFFQVIGGMALAEILFECGDQRKGARYLREVRKTGRTIKNRYLEFMGMLIYADIAIQYGRPSSGISALEYALRLGREMGYASTVWWNPKRMTRLAVTALQRGIEVDYVRSLIRRRNLAPDSVTAAAEDWPWRCRIRAFGQFELERDDVKDAFRGKQGRPLELLKVAVALGGREVHVERITDALWPRIDADYAHRSFNTTLHRLRKQLGDDEAILLQGGKVSLNERWFWTDVWAFERLSNALLERLRSADRFVDGDALVPDASRAIELYRGPLMLGDDAPWVQARRESWQNRFVRCMLAITRYLVDAGNADKAVVFLERGLEADELAEGLYRQLMLCHQRLRRSAEAIEAYNRCRKTLLARLDVAPSPETQGIYEQILAATQQRVPGTSQAG